MFLLGTNESSTQVGFQIGGHESCVHCSQARVNEHVGERWNENRVQIMDVMGARAMYLPGDDGQGTESLQSPDLQKTGSETKQRNSSTALLEPGT